MLVVIVVLLCVLSTAAIVTETAAIIRPLVIGMTLGALVALLSRESLRVMERRLRSGGRMVDRVLVVGHSAPVEALEGELRRDASHGLRVVGRAGVDDDITLAAQEADADVVMVLACPELDRLRLRRMAWDLERLDVDLLVAPGILDVAAPRLAMRTTAGVPVLHLGAPDLRGSRRVVKSLLDRLTAGMALVVLAVPLTVIALVIRIDSPGRALFRQWRVGVDGAEFLMLKFRSMAQDAESRRHEIAHLDVHGGSHLFKVVDDPRVTRLGRVLRRYSLDELPQLVNVVRGEMSLIGPRPALPSEVAAYAPDTRRRLRVKPGITGLWQVSGRSDLTVEESVRLDLWYVDNWSLALDGLIAFKTLSAVLRRTGAY